MAAEGPSKAIQLKTEGNSLFGKQDFIGAYNKYSDAILLDVNNAVLYANRAACCLAIKKYIDAAADAKKATEIDPKYAKAWARLATAQQHSNQLTQSIDSWQNAVSSMSTDNLTPSEMKAKAQYEEGLKGAQNARENMKKLVVIPESVVQAGKMPWDRARAMRAELMQQGGVPSSSAWVILPAYEEFMEGINTMKFTKVTQTPNGPVCAGIPTALTAITNGILRDQRAFHIADQNWVDTYNNQVMFEATKFEAWVNKSDSEDIIQSAQARVREKGWDIVRPALSVTVRALMMRGFIMGGLAQDKAGAVEYLGRALELLELGQKTWRNVPREDRGTIFDATFARGVRTLHLDALMQMYSHKGANNTEQVTQLERILDEAEEILTDVKLNPPPEQGEYDPGFISSFWTYPLGRALSMKGFYHNQMAKRCATRKKKVATFDHLSKVAQFYLEAAEYYPEDDEQHAWFLNCGLEALFKCGTPLRGTQPVMRRIRDAAPKMRRIWENSSMGMGGIDKALQRIIWFEEDTSRALHDGKLKLDDQILPDNLQKPL